VEALTLKIHAVLFRTGGEYRRKIRSVSNKKRNKRAGGGKNLGFTTAYFKTWVNQQEGRVQGETYLGAILGERPSSSTGRGTA